MLELILTGGLLRTQCAVTEYHHVKHGEGEHQSQIYAVYLCRVTTAMNAASGPLHTMCDMFAAFPGVQ